MCASSHYIPTSCQPCDAQFPYLPSVFPWPLEAGGVLPGADQTTWPQHHHQRAPRAPRTNRVASSAPGPTPGPHSGPCAANLLAAQPFCLPLLDEYLLSKCACVRLHVQVPLRLCVPCLDSARLFSCALPLHDGSTATVSRSARPAVPE